MFVAPVTSATARTPAAGSVITEDVPPGALAVARRAAAQHRGLGQRNVRARRAEAAARARRARADGDDRREHATEEQ